jgi:internalin A
VSADFVDSDYCWEKEMKRALERHDAREARVVPIIIRKVNWNEEPFAKLQALPEDAEAVTEWSSRDAAWTNVSQGIERIVKGIRRKRR